MKCFLPFPFRIILRKTLDDLKTIFYMIVIKSDNMAGEKKVFDSVRSVECACRSEAGELVFQLLCCGMVVPPNSVYDGATYKKRNKHFL